MADKQAEVTVHVENPDFPGAMSIKKRPLPAYRNKRLLLLSALLLFAKQATAQTPADEALMSWERGINDTRIDRLLALTPQIMPDCDIAVSQQDAAAFYVYWRFVAQEEIDQRKALGWPLDDSDFEKRRLQAKQYGMTILHEYQLPELTHVGPELPNANDAVVHEIKIWKALHCVVTRYGANRFFTSNGDSRMGMKWPYDSILSTFGYDLIPLDPEKTKSYRLPNMMDIEPLDALGRFFREAEAKGDLTLGDEDAEKYFFQRYESDYFYNMTDASKARAWFLTPPWKPEAPHLERPTRSLPSHR